MKGSGRTAVFHERTRWKARTLDTMTVACVLSDRRNSHQIRTGNRRNSAKNAG